MTTVHPATTGLSSTDTSLKGLLMSDVEVLRAVERGVKKRYLGAEEHLADVRKARNHWGSAALKPRVNAAPAGSRPQPDAKIDEC